MWCIQSLGKYSVYIFLPVNVTPVPSLAPLPAVSEERTKGRNSLQNRQKLLVYVPFIKRKRRTPSLLSPLHCKCNFANTFSCFKMCRSVQWSLIVFFNYLSVWHLLNKLTSNDYRKIHRLIQGCGKQAKMSLITKSIYMTVVTFIFNKNIWYINTLHFQK